MGGLEPHTFWMSFDEFCSVFRCIFICHYYSENALCWKRKCLSGEWSCGYPDNRENTAPGLPSRHNPCCEVERNPQYSVVIHRPTTLRVSVKQVHTKGVYVILVGAFQAEMEGHFTLSVISNNEVLIAQIWPPTWRSQNRQVTVEQKRSGHV